MGVPNSKIESEFKNGKLKKKQEEEGKDDG